MKTQTQHTMNVSNHQTALRLRALALLSLLILGTSQLGAQVPQVINYQGRIQNSGTNPPGPTLDFKFALMNPNGTTTFWSHDNTSVNSSEPAGWVTLPVNNGLFSVGLGDTDIPGMTKSVASTVFDHSDVRLRIWVRDTNAGPAFTLLSPDQQLGAVGYAMMSAGLVNGTVTQNKLGNAAVTEIKLADGAVTTPKLADGAVTAPKISGGTISDAALADGAVTTAKLAIGAVTETRLAGAAVTSGILADNAVSAPKIASNAVTTPKIVNGAVTVAKLGADVLALISSNAISDTFGTCSNCGLVDILGATNCNPAITLDGCSSQVTVWNRSGNGRQMVLLDGQDNSGAGFVRVRGTNDDVIFYSAVELNGNGPSGSSEINVRNAFHNATVELMANGPGLTSGGYVAVSDIQGHPAVELRGDQGTTNKGGWIGIYPNGSTNAAIILDATESRGCPRITTPVLAITGGCDLSENFDIKANSAEVEPGMIVCIDPDNPGHLVASSKAYDSTVAGIVSGAGGIRPGMLMGQQDSAINGRHPVALTGRVYCLVDAGQGGIQPGDLITTSNTAGYGMRAADPARAHGAIIGKAMTRLERGKGLVLVLVSLQ